MTSPAGTTWLQRIGLALAAPRWALTVAVDRQHAGRAGSDLIRALGVVLLAGQLSGVFLAAWLGERISIGTGLNTLIRVLGGAFEVDLAFLVISALLLYALSGAKRELGRAFDLACVAAVPLLAIELAGTALVRGLGMVDVAPIVQLAVSGAAFAWSGSILALAIRPARIAPARVPAVPEPELRKGRIAGRAAAALAVIGLVVQVAWIVENLDFLRPMADGDPAPPLSLREIGPGGTLGATHPLEAARGHVVVLDFWAPWCQPCLHSLPGLNAIAKARPDVTVMAVDIDDPAGAREIFDHETWASLVLVATGDDARDRYGVQSIPHTVVIDKAGVVRAVFHGGGNLEAAIDPLR